MVLDLATMGSSHLAGHAKNPNDLWEPQRTNNGLLFFERLPDAVAAGGARRNLVLALESFAIPPQTNTPQEMGYLNNTVKFAGRAVTDDMNVVFRDFVDKDVLFALQRWRALVYNMFQQGGASPVATGSIGYAAVYKADAAIYLLGPDGSYMRSTLLHGVWPQTLDQGEVNMETEDVMRITVNFSVDRVIPVIDRTDFNQLSNRGEALDWPIPA